MLMRTSAGREHSLLPILGWMYGKNFLNGIRRRWPTWRWERFGNRESISCLFGIPSRPGHNSARRSQSQCHTLAMEWLIHLGSTFMPLIIANRLLGDSSSSPVSHLHATYRDKKMRWSRRNHFETWSILRSRISENNGPHTQHPCVIAFFLCYPARRCDVKQSPPTLFKQHRVSWRDHPGICSLVSVPASK